jgi:energy-coupling factor transport system permease protein
VVIAFAAALIAFGVRGWTAPLIVLALMIASAAWAGIWRGFRPYLLVLTPLVLSIMLINTFLYPGADDPLFDVGPFTATGAGLTAALQAALRVVAFATSVGVFALTTRASELVDDLERRGLGRRPTFVISAAIGTVPRMADRAREIVDAQRARGMDTEGGIVARIRGLLPLAGPLVLGALTEVEQRSMALEARAFAAPGRRTPLRPYPDSTAQRALRWSLVLLTAILVTFAILGLLSWLP